MLPKPKVLAVGDLSKIIMGQNVYSFNSVSVVFSKRTPVNDFPPSRSEHFDIKE